MKEFVSNKLGVNGVRAEDAGSFGREMEHKIVQRQKDGVAVALPPEIYLDHWRECVEEAKGARLRIWLSPDLAVTLVPRGADAKRYEATVMWRTKEEVSCFSRPPAALETIALSLQKAIDEIKERALS